MIPRARNSLTPHPFLPLPSSFLPHYSFILRKFCLLAALRRESAVDDRILARVFHARGNERGSARVFQARFLRLEL